MVPDFQMWGLWHCFFFSVTLCCLPMSYYGCPCVAERRMFAVCMHVLLSYFFILFFISHFYFLCGSVAEWLGSRTCNQQVAGSNPGRRAAECNPGQGVYTHVPLSPSSIIWYRTMDGDARRLAESNGSLPSSLWLRSPAG